MGKIPVIVYDVDGTLFRWQLALCLMEALSHSYPQVASIIEETRPLFQGYKAREVSFNEFVQSYVQKFWAERRFVGIRAEDVVDAAERAASAHEGRTYVFTRELLRAAKSLGYFAVAISGSPQEIVEAFLRPFGVDHVIAVRHQVEDGVYADRDIEDPVRDKGQALRSYLRTLGPEYDVMSTVVIGDSPMDASMLAHARWPLCFNPNRELRREAQRKNWPVILEVRNTHYFLKHGRMQLLEESQTGLHGALPTPLADALSARLLAVEL